MSPQARGLAWIGAAFVLAVGAVFGLPKAARHVPLSWERRLGAALGAPSAAACPASPELARLVARIDPLGERDKALPVEVTLVRSREVNAFATLGGRVYVNSALLEEAESPEELAGVLAHELEHVRRRHIAESLMSRLVTGGALQLLAGGGGAALGRMLLDLSFSRGQERQADEGALERLKAARVSTAGFGAFFERLARKGGSFPLLSDHPASDARAELARSYAGSPAEPLLDADAWAKLKNACR